MYSVTSVIDLIVFDAIQHNYILNTFAYLERNNLLQKRTSVYSGSQILFKAANLVTLFLADNLH